MFYSLRWLSPIRLLGKYSLTRSVEELDREKDPEKFGALSNTEPSLLRCHSLPSVIFTKTLSETASNDSRTCSLIDQLTCSHYLTPIPHHPPPHQCITIMDEENNPIASCTSDGEEESSSIPGEGKTMNGFLSNGVTGYTTIKVHDYCIVITVSLR